MAEVTPFEWLCARLDERTGLTLLETRGTVRLALKASGLDAGTVRASELAVVLERVLPSELASRGVEDAHGLTAALAKDVLLESCVGECGDGPDTVFERLGR
jgi:hypothetical protein